MNPPSLADVLWQYLESRRGLMFCTQCLAKELGAPGRLDRAVIRAEGRGAQRRYGRCPVCGQQRLLCGLAPS